MKLPELKELAKQMGLRGTSTMRKPELLATLQAARNGGEAPEGVTVRAPKNTEPRRTRTAEQTPAAEPAAPQAAAAPEHPAAPAAPAAEPAEQAERRARRAAHERQSADEFASTLLDELDLGAKPESREHRHQDEVDDSGQPMRRRRRGERDQKHAPADRQRASEPDHELDDILAALPDQKHEDEGADHEFSRRNRNRGDRNNNAAGNDRRQRRMRGRDRENTEDREEQQRPQEDLVPVAGIVDVLDSYAFVRTSGYLPGPNDVYVSMGQVKKYGLRKGDAVHGTIRPPREGERRNQRQKFVPLQAIDSINGMSVEEAANRPQFAKLTPLYPQERLKQETTPNKLTGRLIDIVAPIGKGQRGLIVSPPKAGKTITLQNIANAITTNNPEVHLMVVLVDERPEEVTDMQRSIRGDVVASTFDMPADNHTRVSELVIERAKRIVEMGGDVVVVLDSITRLARAYNLAAPASGRILSGGVDSAALYPPKRFLGAARNIENGGSLTILASALVDTGSKMDEVIFEEFKGTGNMELKLDRDLADRRIFPAIDPVQSGTRNEDLLIDKSIQPFVWGIRRILANMNNTERAAASFIKGLKGTNSNEEFLIRSAKKAADHPDAM